MIKWTRPSSSGFTVSDQKLDGGKACMGIRLFWDNSRSKALQLLQCVFCIEASFLLGNSFFVVSRFHSRTRWGQTLQHLHCV